MKTSKPSWRKALSDLRFSLPKTEAPARVTVVGIGSELRGDDAAGLVTARRLAKRIENRSGLMVYEAGPVPENAMGPLRRFGPQLVLLVDAAEMGLAPGAIRRVDRSEIDGLSASTHTFPLSFIMEYFSKELACPVELFAIQPAGMEFDAPASVQARRAGGRLAKAIAEVFGEVG